MSAPIINADSIGNHMTIVEAYSELRDIASRLETDRAALMESLAEIHQESEMGSFAETRAWDALAAARANFPAGIIGG